MLGLIRDIVITGLLGTGVALDTFVVMMKVPSVFRRLFAEGAFNQAFIPVLSEYREKDNTKEVSNLINSVFSILSSVLLLITILALIAAPFFVLIFAPGFYFEPLKKQLAIDILQITFPYLFLVSLVALSGAILNTYDRFSLPALTPLFYNLVLITFGLWIAPAEEIPVYALAWGVFVAGCVQVLIQIYPLMSMGLLPRFKLNFNHPGARRVMYLMVPGIIAGGVSQINMLVDTILASLLPTGSPSWLYVSDRLMQLPLGIFAIAISTVILPKLSLLHAEGSKDSFSNTIDWAIKLVLLAGIPAVIGLVVLAEPIILTLFERGEFSSKDTMRTAYSLIALALGLVGFMLIKVLIPGFFAQQRPKTPLKIAFLSMILNAVLAWFFAFFLEYGHVGLAAASSIAAFFSVFCLIIILTKEKIYIPGAGWFYFLARIIFGSILLFIMLNYLSVDIEFWRKLEVFERVLRLFFLCSGGVVIYILTLWISGLRFNQLTN